MKFKSVLILILSVFFAAPVLRAADNVGVDAPAMTVPAAAADTFRAVVTGDGKLSLNPGKVFSQGDDVPFIQLPYLVSASKAIRYPRWALRQGWEGELVVAVEILPNGKVGRSMVMQSTGHAILDEAAVSSMKTWEFHPATKDGKPVLTCIQIPVRFQIDSKA